MLVGHFLQVFLHIFATFFFLHCPFFFFFLHFLAFHLFLQVCFSVSFDISGWKKTLFCAILGWIIAKISVTMYTGINPLDWGNKIPFPSVRQKRQTRNKVISFIAIV